MNWYVYIVQGKDESLYTGITNNISKRIWLHNNKLGARSLFGKLPVKLVYNEKLPDQVIAAKRKREIKGCGRPAAV
jgi:putative endonuclease